MATLTRFQAAQADVKILFCLSIHFPKTAHILKRQHETEKLYFYFEYMWVTLPSQWKLPYNQDMCSYPKSRLYQLVKIWDNAIYAILKSSIFRLVASIVQTDKNLKNQPQHFSLLSPQTFSTFLKRDAFGVVVLVTLHLSRKKKRLEHSNCRLIIFSNLIKIFFCRNCRVAVYGTFVLAAEYFRLMTLV